MAEIQRDHAGKYIVQEGPSYAHVTLMNKGNFIVVETSGRDSTRGEFYNTFCVRKADAEIRDCRIKRPRESSIVYGDGRRAGESVTEKIEDAELKAITSLDAVEKEGQKLYAAVISGLNEKVPKFSKLGVEIDKKYKDKKID